MNNCQITFKEDDKMIIVDFTLDDDGNADYNVRFHPELKDKDENIGLKGHLCQIFLEALHGGSSEHESEPDVAESNAN